MDNNNKVEWSWSTYLAELAYQEGDFALSKQHYDEALDRISNDFALENLGMLYEISYNYIDTIISVKKYDISDKNPNFVAIEKIKQKIQDKLAIGEQLTEDESNTHKLMVYGLNYCVHWGNHAGTKIIDILRDEPDYILWCILNLEHFAISDAIFLFPNIRRESNYHQALEKNLVKKAIIEKWRTFEEDNNEYSGYSDDYEPSYDEYGGAHGYDDDTIDDAFEGDPDNCWNVD